jgi:hypothetical protein
MLNVYLVNQLVKHTFECELNCGYLIDRTLQTDGSPLSLCKGVAIPFTPLELIPEMALGPLTIPGLRIGPFTIIPEITLGPVEFPGITIPEGILPIVPALANVIDPPLEGLRQLIAWSIILFFALASVLLAYVARLLLTPEGRRAVLTNLSIFLVFFVILSAVVFIQVVR